MENPFERLMETRRGQRLLGLVLALLGSGLIGGAFAMLETRGEYFVVMPFLGSFGALLGLGVLIFPGLGRVRGQVLRPSPWICGVSLAGSVVYGLWFLNGSGLGA